MRSVTFLHYQPRHYAPEQIVSLANGRCNRRTYRAVKNGVNAMRMPVDDLLSNWGYMVMTFSLEFSGLGCSCPC